MDKMLADLDTPTKFNVNVTDEEAKAFDEVVAQIQDNKKNGKDFDYNIDRLKLLMVSKLITPFAELAKIFINVQRGRGNSEVTIKHYEQSIKKMERFFCWLNDEKGIYDTLSKEDQVMIGSATPIAVLESDYFEADYRDYLIEVEGVSDITVNTYFRDYRAIAYYAMEEELIRKKNIVIKNVEADLKEVYTDEELDKLLKEPSKDCNFAEYRNWVVVNWLVATGNRVSTIVNVKIKDLLFDEGFILIQTQKNKKKIRIPMADELKPILTHYIRDCLIDENGNYTSIYLFPSVDINKGNIPMSRTALSKSIAVYNKSRGVNKTSIHLFRHTFAKNWIINGGDLHGLQRMLGHSTLDMVTHYANLYSEDLKPMVADYALIHTHKHNYKGKSRRVNRI